MIWILSLLLCFVLGMCVLCVLMPDLLGPGLINHWRKHFHYWRF